MTHDVAFTINTGDYKGKVYKYTLAENQGVKAWNVTPQFRPAPSMIKEKIEMVLVAREANISRSGAIELRQVSRMLTELTEIAKQTNVTLTGLDYQDRPILIDLNGFTLSSVANETNRNTEYHVDVTCWGLYN